MTPGGESWIVVSKTGLRSDETVGIWDALSVIQQEDQPTVTVESLRALLQVSIPSEDIKDLPDEILVEEAT